MINKFTVGVALIALAYYFGIKTSLPSSESEKASPAADVSAVLTGWEQQVKPPDRKIKKVALG